MVQAPTGTVTLVFTDIEGSTTLWEHLGPDFQPMLDLHDALMRSAIAGHDGYEGEERVSKSDGSGRE